MPIEQTRELIRGFLTRAFGNCKIQDNDDIFARGFVSSLFAMELVMFVEKTFGVAIENEDLEIENFCSVNAIASLIERKNGRNDPSPH